MDADPEGVFEKSVKRCVRRWQFSPGTVGGEPVKTRAQTTIRFRLSWLESNCNHRVIRRLAVALCQLGQPEKALEAINSLEAQAQESDLLLLQGELHYEMEQFNKAAQSFRLAAR